MHSWQIIGLCSIGFIWIGSVVFVAWLYPDKPKVLPFRKKR